MNLEWRTAYDNPRLHYLYRGKKFLGLVGRLGTGENAKGYSVFRATRGNSEFSNHDYLTTTPTLDEAKGLLQTIAGSQL